MTHTALLGSISVVLTLTGCGSEPVATSTSAEAPSPVLQQAHEACQPKVSKVLKAASDEAPPAREVLQIEDGGESVLVTTPEPGGEILSAIAYQATSCVLEESGAPATIAEQMQGASALSGQEEAEYDGISVTWSYAAGAGNGFSATFTE